MAKRSKEELEEERKKELLRTLRRGPDLERFIDEQKRNFVSYAQGARMYDKSDKEAERRRLAYCFKMIREKSGMSRTDFSVWLGVPYRTMQEWELGRRAMPEYVLRLIAYKVMNELREGRIG